MLISTIGHSTRSIDDFIRLLEMNGIDQLADIRTIPRSRHNPQFNQESLCQSLTDVGLRYEYLPLLGGLRHPQIDSVNTGWRNSSFRGFADYMQTSEFEQGLAQLIKLAAQAPVAIMCAEAVPWRCHRSLIADALVTREIAVQHIEGERAVRSHTLTPFAKVEGERVTYPGLQISLE